MQKIVPFLWFDGTAEEAVKFYCSVFPDAKMGRVLYYGPNMPQPEGCVLTINFEIHGQEFCALNGGGHFQLTPAISFMVNCYSQEEVDILWEKLAEGGEKMPCGWVTDKFGVTWQITPKVLLDMMHDSDKTKVENVTQAMMQMEKIDIPTLQAAYNAS